jgi:hypothetical protein
MSPSLPSHVLCRMRPARDELIAGRILVADEGHICDVDPEEVKPARSWCPAELRPYRGRVLRLHIRGVLNDSASANFVLACCAVSGGDDVVHEHAVIAKQVGRLSRTPQHRQPEIAIPEERLDRADSWGTVRANGANHNNARVAEPLLAQCRELGLLTDQLTPVHRSSHPIQRVPLPAIACGP